MAQSLATEKAEKNPLMEGMQIAKRATPFTMTILGAHGDLTKRKLVPALYALFLEDLLPKNFAMLGISRTAMTDEQFRTLMKESLQKFATDLDFSEESWAQFAKSLHYQASDVTKDGGFDSVVSRLDDLKNEHGTEGNNVFYLSTAPSLYIPIVKGLAKSGLATKARPNQTPWPRIIVEKPFGHDLKSSEDLDEVIHEMFNEHQVYRIDHYLGKETVQNIMVLRFANAIFEPLWNNRYVDHIQITNAETLGVEGRGSYYEEAGNLRDMVQNHLMQLVSLIAMEPPISQDPEATRDEKVKVLKCLRSFDVSQVDQYAVRGQYGPGYILGQSVPGYRQEEGVSPTSTQNTFTALKAYIENWRWAGVPFYVRSGKRLAKGLTEIAVHFKRPPHRLFGAEVDPSITDKIEQMSPNVLVMQIQPDEGLTLKFATKQPGQTTQIRWLNMDFKYGTAFGVRTPTAYERLIHDCLLGDPSLFSRTDQVDVCWQFVQPIIDCWESNRSKIEFPNYAAGSWGPEAADKLIESTGHAWRRL